MTEQHNGKDNEGQLAMDIIQQWKAKPSIRTKFNQCLARYADYRQGNKQIVPIFSRGYN